MDVQIGKYDRSVTLYKPTEVVDEDSGASTPTFASDGTVSCYLNERMNNEQFTTVAKRADVKRITIDTRYKEVDETIDTTWQIEFESKRYNVIESFEATEFGRNKVRRIRAERAI